MNMYIQSILGGIFILYMAHSMWSMAQLFTNIKCSGFPCYKSYLNSNPKLQLALFTSVTSSPLLNDVKKIASLKSFNYNEPYARELEIDIPLKTRRNGTLFLHVVLAKEGEPLEWKSLQRDGPTVIHKLKLTEYAVPQAATFNLLGDKKTEDVLTKSKMIVHPVTHLQSKANVVMLTDSFTMSQEDIPPELARLIRVNVFNEFLPIVQTDFFRTRIKDLTEITKNSTNMILNFGYNPISTGKIRLMLQIEHATKNMQNLGFTNKDIDEIKGIFSDTNEYLLCGTVFVGSIHILFDFLSFKNDVLFWKRKRNYAGLSMRTTIWRAFSQIVIFLYLLDENTSMLVLIPAGIGAIIELWKCKKILKIELTIYGFHKIKEDESTQIVKDEKVTQAIDREAMRYLSYLLYPLCFCGAVYSLIYQPHKSWYSWTLNSLVNGVYAFGFLFMLPQLFVNYKLKSVAALPWRAFMYKAFNTFIDDIFAFIITMPTAHRVACFRDDVVFIIYLYQRWLYPVDKSRLDSGGAFEIEGEADTKIVDEKNSNNDKAIIKEENTNNDNKKTQ